MTRSRLTVLGALVFLAAVVRPPNAAAQIKMEIYGQGGGQWAMAVPELKNLGGDGQHEISGRFDETLARDLRLSNYFRIIDPHAYIENSQTSGYDIGQFNFADWRSINADFLVKGAVRTNGSKVELTAFLFDVAQQRRMMGKTYNGDSSEVARMARRFADAVLKAVTGVEGPFDSKLAFVSTRGGRFKEIWIQFIDGEDTTRLTDNPTINLFPSWDRSAHDLLYLSYKTMAPALYLANVEQRREIRIRSSRGRIIGGALAPDAQSIVAAIESHGVTNLYLLDRTGREMRPLTNGGSINVSPAFSPDGSTIAFTSDRSGTPQIYVMPAIGGSARRLTYTGNYNTTPAFSPKGDRIAYQGREGGHFDIFVIPAGGGQPARLTDGIGSSESPTWSPDGRYIAFSSTRGARSRIYLLQVSSRKIISALTEGNGNDSCPAWSWWLAE
jgi:TolB protein